MESITEIINQPTTPAASATGPSDLGKDDFLRLLVAQLQNQDPLRPLDSTSFIAELAQFSQLEQSTKQVQLLERGLEAHETNLRFNLLPLVGRQVRIEGAVIELGNTPAPIAYTLEEDAQAVTVTIEDVGGQVIRTFELGPQISGAQQIEWDGKDQSSNPVPPGIYQFTVTARDGQGEHVGTSTTSVLTVTGIRLLDSKPLILVGELALDPDQVVDIL